MRIITDSTSDLTPELCAQLGVDLVIPMKITIDGREYLDKVDITDEDYRRGVDTILEEARSALGAQAGARAHSL